jgi:predicted cupin superfamily sugar epimerase
MDASEAIKAWQLEPHPEGGYFRETYRSALAVNPPGWSAGRSLATSILYLLPFGERSAWHRVRGEELWLWQGGSAMRLFVDDDVHRVGPDVGAGESLQVLVPAGGWQSAEPTGGDWSLVACVVAPGFDFADFELRGD